MGDTGQSDSWKKLVIAKANDQWISISGVKKEQTLMNSEINNGINNFSMDNDPLAVKTEIVEEDATQNWHTNASPATPNPEILLSPLPTKKKKGETGEDRAARLSKMSAYAAQRLANESREQRASRLKRMSEYAAKRLANETSEQRAKRLARMSAYAAKRLAQETPEQRRERLARMSAYASRRHAMKKLKIAKAATNSFPNGQDEINASNQP